MNKLTLFAALALAFALPTGVLAQKPTPPAPKPGAMAPPKAPKPAKNVSYSGPVKGMPTGSTFTLALRKGPITVDASKATMTYQKKPATVAMIKGGTFVTVVGKRDGSTLQASKVTINRMTGEKKGGVTNTPPKKP